jgi:phosphatidylglycerophosphate synthase
MAMTRPWDARLANALVQPFREGPLTPNHFTTLRLATGLSGALLLAGGRFNTGAWLIVLSNFLDHADGELARISGKSTRFGHYYDLASDAVITIALFISLGAGMSRAGGGMTMISMGVVAGVAVAVIFQLRHALEQAGGKAAVQQPRVAGLEAEDILYLLPLVTHFSVIREFLIAAAVGAPVVAGIVGCQYTAARRRNKPCEPS